MNVNDINLVTFEECQVSGYRERTIVNASADATIAFAVDFTTAGEKLTKNSVVAQKRKYIAIDANSLEVTKERIDKVVKLLNTLAFPDCELPDTSNDVSSDDDGKTHINIYSKGGTNLGKSLSNFAHTPFDWNGETFNSVESFWYWYRIRNSITGLFGVNEDDMETLKTLHGSAAKETGKLLLEKYVQKENQDKARVPEEVLAEIYMLKLLHHPKIKKMLLENELPFAHYYVFNDVKVNADAYLWTADLWRTITEELRSGKRRITINIAGNGMYTMRTRKCKYTQEQVDTFTYDIIKSVIESPDLKVKIRLIRSGGQSGFDIAGNKAAFKLGIPTLVLAPKGWVYRGEDGKDVKNERIFKERLIKD